MTIDERKAELYDAVVLRWEETQAKVDDEMSSDLRDSAKNRAVEVHYLRQAWRATEQGTYTARTRCENCNTVRVVRVPIGVSVGRGSKCGICGVGTLMPSPHVAEIEGRSHLPVPHEFFTGLFGS